MAGLNVNGDTLAKNAVAVPDGLHEIVKSCKKGLPPYQLVHWPPSQCCRFGKTIGSGREANIRNTLAVSRRM